MPIMIAQPHARPSGVAAALNAPAKPVYRVSLASSAADLRAAQALRFEVFNLELDEGLVQSYDTGLDADPFDDVCDHLIIDDAISGQALGTYRLQTGARAAQGLGYYSAREFDFAPLQPHRSEILELGRACIHHAHRSFAVLNLLWKGIGVYAQERGARYLIGCSSLTSQDASAGAPPTAHCCRAWRRQPGKPGPIPALPAPCSLRQRWHPRFLACSRPIWHWARPSAARRHWTASSAPSTS